MKTIKSIFYDILGTLAVSIGLYSFAEKVDIAPGGLSGISLMIRYLTALPIGITMLVLNIPLLVVAYKFMGRKFTLKTMRTVLINTIILDVIVTPFFPQYGGDRLLGSLFTGVFVGAGLSVVFMNGSSTAGTDIIGHLIERRFPHISIGKALMMVDCIILGVSALVFRNIESALYGIVALFTQTVVINKLVYGSEKGRNLFIISQKSESIAQRILQERDRGATFLTAQGAYSKKPTSVLMCVVRVWEYHHIKEIVYEEDPRAFVIATEAEHIIGEGFTR
ncbi:MAG: YitT family protein [Clostridia bacterium]|nr:YitT family protein [Clostridia bacterium]